MKVSNKKKQSSLGQFCPKCYSAEIKKRSGSSGFKCQNCDSELERLIIIDEKINYWFDDDDNYWHESVGAIITNSKNKILLIKLNKFPFGYSIPAGHVNNQEAPKDAARREILEEVGIKTDNLQTIVDVDLQDDPCRRGADHHKWHLYQTAVNEDEVVRINHESSGFIWADPKKALKLKLTSPARRFINMLVGASEV